MAQVISMVNTALGGGERSAMLELASKLDYANNYGCPLGNVSAAEMMDSVDALLFLPVVQHSPQGRRSARQ